MFGFVRPAACRSSAPRSVTDGCPHPPLPRRAKNRNKIQLSSHRKQEISGNGGDSFHRCKLLPPLRRSPSLKEGGLGFRRSRPPALPSIGYRGFAVAPMTLRAPSRIFFYYSGSRVATLVVSMGVMGFLAKRVYSFHRQRGGPPPSRREVWGFAGQGLRPCRRLYIGALRSPLSPFARRRYSANFRFFLPKDLPLRGRGTARRRWKEFSVGGRRIAFPN